MNKSSMLLLTLASNGKDAVVPKDNIAFAIELEGENDRKEKQVFTRIYLKQVTMNDESKWVDVKEPVKYIMK